MHSKKGKRTQSNLKYFNYYENIVIFYYILPWLNYGDANTKFFHLKTPQNHSQSHIMTLKDSTGLWVSEDMLTTHVIVVFTKLFTSTSPHTVSHFPLVRYYHQNNPLLEQHQRLSSTPLPEEIYHNVFSLPPLKALGPNGHHAIFFQQNWHILGHGIIHAIQEIFETVIIPEDSGAINLVLIPKINHPYMITQFRLISLCNTLYKLVSRIILQRLKPYIVDIINSC